MCKISSKVSPNLLWLEEAVKLSGLNWTNAFGKSVAFFVDSLMEASKTTNLTGIKDEDKIYRHLVFDSLMVWKVVSPSYGLSVLDVGTGAGFPGVPMKLYFPDARVVLVDANGKKVRFLKEVAYSFDWEEKPIKIHLDSQNKINKFFGKYDIITAKAVGPVTKLAPSLIPYLKPGGKLLFFMGPRKMRDESLLRDTGEVLGTVQEVSLPDISYKRTFYILTKEELQACFT